MIKTWRGYGYGCNQIVRAGDDGVTGSDQSLRINFTEHPMLNSRSAIAAVRRHSNPERASRVPARDRRDIHPEQSAPTTVMSEARSAIGPADTIWRSVLWFFLEGFALYGASVHWVATTAVTAIATEVDARLRQKFAGSQRQKHASLAAPAAGHGTLLGREDAVDRTASGTRMPSTGDGFAPAVREVDRYRFVSPGWLVVIWRVTANRWVIWRRERQIKVTVAALSEQDDRTLRDVGIPLRSQIEQIVRQGRND